MISPDISFIFFLKFSFFELLGGGGGGGGEKNCPKWKIIISATWHISGTGKYMVMSFGTLV